MNRPEPDMHVIKVGCICMPIGAVAGAIFLGNIYGWEGIFFGLLLGGGLGKFLGGIFVSDDDDDFYYETGPKPPPRRANDYGSDASETLARVTFMMAGHVAKAGGRVTDADIQGFNEVVEFLAQHGMGPAECEFAVWSFHAGARGKAVGPNGFDPDDALRALARAAKINPGIPDDAMDILIAMACVGKQLPAAKAAELERCRAALGYPKSAFEAKVEWHLRGKFKGGQPPPRTDEVADLEWAYALLEIESSASASDVRSAYARKMKEIHPDKLAAKELPQALMDLATDRTRDLTRAYQAIRQAHGETVATEEDGVQ